VNGAGKRPTAPISRPAACGRECSAGTGPAGRGVVEVVDAPPPRSTTRSLASSYNHVIQEASPSPRNAKAPALTRCSSPDLYRGDSHVLVIEDVTPLRPETGGNPNGWAAMSAEATGWVIRHSPYTGATFVVHLMVADSVNDQHGNQFWMGQSSLAKKARVSRVMANRALASLLADGFLTLIEDNTRAGKPNCYRFEFPDAPVRFDSRRGGVNRSDTPQVGGVNSSYRGCKQEPRKGVNGVYTEPNKNPRELRAHAQEEEQDENRNLAAFDALPPAKRRALIEQARAAHPLLRGLQRVADSNPMVRAAAAALLEGAAQ
jgi:hypothetical protein